MVGTHLVVHLVLALFPWLVLSHGIPQDTVPELALRLWLVLPEAATNSKSVQQMTLLMWLLPPLAVLLLLALLQAPPQQVDSPVITTSAAGLAPLL